MASKPHLEKLRREVPLETVVSEYTRVVKEGSWLKAVCLNPDHADRGPSLKWKPEDERAHCFGCDWSPDIFEIVMKVEGLEFAEAVRKIESLSGDPQAPRTRWSEEEGPVGKAFKEPLDKQPEYQAVEAWQRNALRLFNHAEAVSFLRSRGLTEQTMRKFSIASVQDGTGVPCEEDHKACPWVGIPYVLKAKVMGVKWRDVRHKCYTATRGMPSMLFNQETQAGEFDDLYVVSGEFDAMVLEQAGFRAVSLQSDTRPPTSGDREILLRAGRIILAGDSDEPGQKAMNKLGMELRAGKVLSWPDKCKDANEVFLKYRTGFAKILEKLLENLKEPMPPGFVPLAEEISGIDQRSPEDDPARFLFPWKRINDMAVILPGHVISLSSTYTGTGKSTFVLQAMLFNAMLSDDMRRKVPCVYAAEQSPDEIARMAVACLAHAPKNHLRREHINQVLDDFIGARFYVGYDPSKTRGSEVVKLCEQAVRHLGVTDLVIDNMGFIGRNARGQNLYENQADIMQYIKNLAKELGIRIWVLCAARKPQGQDRYKEMEMSDLAGTLAFEHDADHVITLHRDLLKNPPEEAKDLMSPLCHVNMKKSRNRGPGAARSTLLLVGAEARFTDQISMSEESQ